MASTKPNEAKRTKHDMELSDDDNDDDNDVAEEGEMPEPSKQPAATPAPVAASVQWSWCAFFPDFAASWRTRQTHAKPKTRR